jgi:hypothetical protein
VGFQTNLDVCTGFHGSPSESHRSALTSYVEGVFAFLDQLSLRFADQTDEVATGVSDEILKNATALLGYVCEGGV